jgi:hypothetical protein
MGENAVCVPSFWMLGESWVVESTQGVDVGVYSEAQLSIPLQNSSSCMVFFGYFLKLIPNYF